MGGRVVALNHGVMTLLKRMAGIGLLLMLPMNACLLYTSPSPRD